MSYFTQLSNNKKHYQEKMKYAVYVNNEIIFSSHSRYECIEKGLEVLSKELREQKRNNAKKDENEMTAEYLEKVCNFTYNARKADGVNFYAECHFNNKYIEVKPFVEKTYEVIYKVTFEKDVTPNEDFFVMEQRVLCYENKVDKIIQQFRDELERNVENELSLRGETFDDMLGHEVECLQDERTAYDVLDTIHKKYHTIVVNEVNLN